MKDTKKGGDKPGVSPCGGFVGIGRGEILCTSLAFELYCEGYEKIKGDEPRVHRATNVCMNIQSVES